MSYIEFRDAYVEAMLWANTYGMDAGTGEMVTVDMLHGADAALLREEDQDAELTDEAREQLEEDARAFWSEILSIGPDPDALEPQWPSGYTDAQAGHDFALTRNRHGAGFWDRGLGEFGEKLTKAAHAWGEATLEIWGGEIHHI